MQQVGKGMAQPINRYAGYGGNDSDPYNHKTHTFYYSSDDVGNVVWAMKCHASDSELTWWEVRDRANSDEKVIGGWQKDYYKRAKEKWVKNHYWGVALEHPCNKNSISQMA